MKYVLTAFGAALRSDVIEVDEVAPLPEINLHYNPNKGICLFGDSPIELDEAVSSSVFTLHGVLCVDKQGEPIYEYKLTPKSHHQTVN